MQRYPEYYTVIKRPVDMRTIAGLVCAGEYADLDACVADFDLMFTNACTFNEPGSCIYR